MHSNLLPGYAQRVKAISDLVGFVRIAVAYALVIHIGPELILIFIAGVINNGPSIIQIWVLDQFSTLFYGRFRKDHTRIKKEAGISSWIAIRYSNKKNFLFRYSLLLRPVVIIPNDLEGRSLTKEEILKLQHESGHRDFITNIIICSLVAFFWITIISSFFEVICVFRDQCSYASSLETLKGYAFRVVFIFFILLLLLRFSEHAADISAVGNSQGEFSEFIDRLARRERYLTHRSMWSRFTHPSFQSRKRVLDQVRRGSVRFFIAQVFFYISVAFLFVAYETQFYMNVREITWEAMAKDEGLYLVFSWGRYFASANLLILQISYAAIFLSFYYLVFGKDVSFLVKLRVTGYSLGSFFLIILIVFSLYISFLWANFQFSCDWDRHCKSVEVIEKYLWSGKFFHYSTFFR